jgi:peptidoglycan-N-acetylglucosamine deacetylase
VLFRLRKLARRWFWALTYRFEQQPEWSGVFFHERFGRMVTFSFDDGPRECCTAQISRQLADQRISALFFFEGWRVEAYPDIVRQVDADGHIIGNHTYSHELDFNRFSALKTGREIVRTQAAINRVLADRYPDGYPHRLFRPPQGYPWSRKYTAESRRRMMRVLSGLGFQLVLWQIDSGDWARPGEPDRIVETALENLSEDRGGIMLFHDIYPALVPALDTLVTRLRARNVAIVDFFTILLCQRAAADPESASQ